MSLNEAFNDSTNRKTGDNTHSQTSSLAGDLWHSLKEGATNTADRALTGLANFSTSWGDSISRESQPGNKMSVDYKEGMKMLFGDNVVTKGMGKLSDLSDQYIGQAEATVLHTLGNALRPDHASATDKNAASQTKEVVPREMDHNYQQISGDAGRMLNNFSVVENSMSGPYLSREQLRDQFIKKEHQV